ncbi:MAG: c-type cytochrome [Thiotrichaceae bacterium]|nr:c-type cytochrome [Thiotrichaceae bacterium]
MSDSKQAIVKSEKSAPDSLQTFETRWKYAIAPAMLTFVLLIGFMFYLIYGMLQRMQDLSRDINAMSVVIIEAMPVMQGGILGMSSRMQYVGEDMSKMSGNMEDMSKAIVDSMPKLEKNVASMSNNVEEMTVATTSMSETTHNMGQNLWDMNRNFSKPLSAMNKMLPWSNNIQPAYPPPRPMPQRSTMGAPMHRAPVITPAAPRQPVQPATPELKVVNAETVSLKSGKNKYHGFCASCHGIHGEGGVGPLIQGKSSADIIHILEEYRSGKRTGTMTGVVEILSTDDIKNLARFISSDQL